MNPECIVTIKGSGVKNKNNATRPSEDRTGPIGTFLTLHMAGAYDDIFKHVQKCSQCDPDEILQGYIKGRKHPKFQGRTSVTLVSMAQKYERAFPNRVKRKTINEIFYRHGGIPYLAGNERRFTDDEILEGLRIVWQVWEEDWTADKYMMNVQDFLPLLEVESDKSIHRESYLHLGRKFLAGKQSPAKFRRFPEGEELDEFRKLISIGFVLHS